MTRKTVWIIFGIYAGLFICMGLFVAFALWGWRLGRGDLFEKCDNGYTVWAKNPGAFSSLRYEIRDENGKLRTGILNGTEKEKYLESLGTSCRCAGREWCGG